MFNTKTHKRASSHLRLQFTPRASGVHVSFEASSPDAVCLAMATSGAIASFVAASPAPPAISSAVSGCDSGVAVSFTAGSPGASAVAVGTSGATASFVAASPAPAKASAFTSDCATGIAVSFATGSPHGVAPLDHSISFQDPIHTERARAVAGVQYLSSALIWRSLLVNSCGLQQAHYS